MAVQCIHGDIGLAVHEPTVVGKIYLPDPGPWSEPLEFLCYLSPKTLWITDGICIYGFIVLYKCLILHPLGRFYLVLYLGQGLYLRIEVRCHLDLPPLVCLDLKRQFIPMNDKGKDSRS